MDPLPSIYVTISFYYCGRNKSFSNQVLFALGMDRGADTILTNLFNPTSRRDAFHFCLISTWPKEGCTIVCVITPTFPLLIIRLAQECIVHAMRNSFWDLLYDHTHYGTLSKTAAHRLHYAHLSKSNKLARGRWGFPLKPQKKPFCGRNESFFNQVLFTLGMGWGADVTIINLFNPTSGRDADKNANYHIFLP